MTQPNSQESKAPGCFAQKGEKTQHAGQKELEAPLPADVAKADSVGGMARRLLDPAHIRQVAAWCAKVGREEGLEALWREVDFRVRLAFHRDTGATGPICPPAAS